MSRTTVSLDEDQAEWVERQADDLDVSKSKVLRECVDLARGEQSMFTRERAGEKPNHADRLEAIESRIDGLETELTERVQSLETDIEERDAPSTSEQADTSGHPGGGEDDSGGTSGQTVGVVEDGLGGPIPDVQASEDDSNSVQSSIDLEVPEHAGQDELEAHLAEEIDPELVDAVLACWQLLKHRGTISVETLREQYEAYPAGYSSEADWWTDGITPVLNELPRVKPPAEGGSFWQFKYQ